MTTIRWRILAVALTVGCGESHSNDVGAKRHGQAGSGGSAGADVAGSGGGSGASLAGMAGASVGPPDFTLPRLPDKSAADLTLTSDNEALFYRMAVNAIVNFMPALQAGSLSRAGLIDGTPPDPSPDFYFDPSCVDQTVTQGTFTRTACGRFLGEYKLTSGTSNLSLESRLQQTGDQTVEQRHLDEYTLDGAILRASEHVGVEVTTNDLAPIFWLRVASHYELPRDLFAGKNIDSGPYWLSISYPYKTGLEVHVQSVATSPVGYIYDSLTGFDGHFLLDTMTSDTAPTLRFKITDHAGTTRCFFGEEPPNMVYYLGEKILTDANCDGVSEGSLVVTGG